MKTNPDCIFCKIVAGEIPACKILEDDVALAFMDIGPVAEGHVLLIPKEHYETISDIPEEPAAAILKKLPQLVAAVQTATGSEGVNVLQNNGTVAGQLVPHVHFHIIPRNPGDKFEYNWPVGEYPEGKMPELADKIKKVISRQ